MTVDRSRQVLSSSPLIHGDGAAWAKAHLALAEDKELWQRLQFQGLFVGAYPGELFEMRCCPQCGSTVNRPISLTDAAVILGRQAQMVATAVDLVARSVAANSLVANSVVP